MDAKSTKPRERAFECLGGALINHDDDYDDALFIDFYFDNGGDTSSSS